MSQGQRLDSCSFTNLIRLTINDTKIKLVCNFKRGEHEIDANFDELASHRARRTERHRRPPYVGDRTRPVLQRHCLSMASCASYEMQRCVMRRARGRSPRIRIRDAKSARVHFSHPFFAVSATKSVFARGKRGLIIKDADRRLRRGKAARVADCREMRLPDALILRISPLRSPPRSGGD